MGAWRGVTVGAPDRDRSPSGRRAVADRPQACAVSRSRTAAEGSKEAAIVAHEQPAGGQRVPSRRWWRRLARPARRPSVPRDTTLRQGHALPLAELSSTSAWVALGATFADSDLLADTLEAVLPTDRRVTRMVLDAPGWRAQAVTVPAHAVVVVAAAPPGATLSAVAAFAAHPGPLVLLGEAAGAAEHGPARLPHASRVAGRGHGVLVVLDLAAPTLALVRHRPFVVTSPPAGRSHPRRRRLAATGARLAAVGPAADLAVGSETWAGLAQTEGASAATPLWEGRFAAGPDLVLLDPSDPTAPTVRSQAAAAGCAVSEVTEAWPVPAFDPALDNPIGWRREPDHGVVALDVAACGQDVLTDGSLLPATTSRVQEVCLRGAARAPARAAHLTVRLAARGVPVRLDDACPAVTERFGTALRAALARLEVLDLTDVEVRERASVDLRRAAFWAHAADVVVRNTVAAAGLPARPLPPVSVLLATRRPELLATAVRQVAAQTHPALELVVLAHAPGVSEAARKALARTDSLPAQIVEVDPGAPLGAALNAGVAAAGGELLTKMDDDDRYGVHHVADCVAALHYAGAPLVGKGSEFVYLAALDHTVRRSSRHAERYDAMISGASLTLSRADLRELGGWAPTSRAVDRRLIDAVERAGERTYRLHGLEFLVERHDRDHTWSAPASYFLRATDAQWPGCALEQAAIDA